MKREEYIAFKKEWLETFKGYYRKGRVNRNILRSNVFDNPKLNARQKLNFWKLVTEKNYK